MAGLETLFGDLLDYPPEQRASKLAVIGANNLALQNELEALLNAAERAPGFLSVPQHTAVSDSNPCRIGQRIGAYRLVRQLGSGGMGEVYLAERDDGQFQHQVAIKLIRYRRALLVQRFQAERQILARLSHPYIARLYDGGTLEDGHPYLVMEYVPGEPIDSYCRTRNLPVAVRLELMTKVCRAVQHAHECGIVHRDLKPQNILVATDGNPKLLDFGIAKLLASYQESIAPVTLAGFAPMTPAFAAPEQLQGQAVSTATDVYALGLIVSLLLNECHSCQTADSYPALGLGEGLKPIIQRALAQKPQQRYATAKELADALEDLLTNRLSGGIPAGSGVKTGKFWWGGACALVIAGVIGTMAMHDLLTVVPDRHIPDSLDPATVTTKPHPTSPTPSCAEQLANYRKTTANSDLARLVSCQLDVVGWYNDNGAHQQALNTLAELRPVLRRHPRRVPAVRRINRGRMRQEFDRALAGVRLANTNPAY